MDVSEQDVLIMAENLAGGIQIPTISYEEGSFEAEALDDINESAAVIDPPHPVVMPNYDVADTDEAAGVVSSLNKMKLEFDPTDITFWFAQLEMHLTTAGVGAQWTKRLLLH